MSFRLQVLPAAEEDIAQAAEWDEARHSGLAARFTAEVYQAIRSLADTALIPRVRLKRRQVRWVYPTHFPYRIVYYPCNDFSVPSDITQFFPCSRAITGAALVVFAPSAAIEPSSASH